MVMVCLQNFYLTEAFDSRLADFMSIMTYSEVDEIVCYRGFYFQQQMYIYCGAADSCRMNVLYCIELMLLLCLLSLLFLFRYVH